ncbi:inositol monophosphatase [Zychaea mexicana]|uniref:inositol monophosphatase n=1 Tax=Zychaea mexicana TaxID=64656 RepID=UPI0022FE419D|nr:inositol monophosphatase [Zychaea mexicana]KAI9488487.1 inositol monophosphatase [Zychaea mexicana]
MGHSHDLQEYLSFAIALAKEAGKMIKDATETRMSGTGNQFLVKYDNPTDLVTETDQAVEKYIKKRLSEAYPEHRFIGEETMAEGVEAVFTDEPTWIVDPVDGTTNFVHGHPFVAVSIGLTIGKEPVVGVVYCPLMNELYSAAKGLGAFLNENVRLPLFQPTPPPLGDLSECIVATEAGSDRSPEVFDKKMATIHTILKQKQNNGKQAHSIRCTGSAAINLCTIAKGVVDVYWEVGCWEWDVAAAIVIVRETGGIVVSGGSNPDASPVNIFSRKYLAIRGAQDEASQLKVAHQMWDIIPDIDAPRKAVPGGFEP